MHYGDTTLTFLNNLYQADQRGHGADATSRAVAVEEKSVIDYNQGNPDGRSRSAARSRGKPRVPLVAVYPKEGTLFSDNPYVVLSAAWVDDAKQEGAADFLAYVQATRASRSGSPTSAFRDPNGKPGAA